MQFTPKSWSFHLDLGFAGIYIKEEKISRKAEKMSKNAMSQHQLESVARSHSESQSS